MTRFKRQFPSVLNLYALFKSLTPTPPKNTFTSDLKAYTSGQAVASNGFKRSEISWPTSEPYRITSEDRKKMDDLGDAVFQAAKYLSEREAANQERQLEKALQLRLIERGFDRALARQMVEVFKELVRDINAGRIQLD